MRIFCTSPQLSPQTTLENNGVFFLIGKYMEMRSQKQVHTYMVIFFFNKSKKTIQWGKENLQKMFLEWPDVYKGRKGILTSLIDPTQKLEMEDRPKNKS